jgi:hypothetical protein
MASLRMVNVCAARESDRTGCGSRFSRAGIGCFEGIAVYRLSINNSSVTRNLWCPGRDLNPHSACAKKDFKSFASADFATRAGEIRKARDAAFHVHHNKRLN